MQTSLRNKNAHKNKIDYDLNIFIPEELDENNESFWDPTQWCIDIYEVDGYGHRQVGNLIKLSSDDIHTLGLNRDPYFKDDVDSWYGYEGFMLDYWDKMTDRLKSLLEALPKYKEDYLISS